MNKKDYYSILGLTKNATNEEISKAYRTLAKKFHPDVNKEPGAAEIFKAINEANKVLSDPATRKEYDKQGFVEGYNAIDSFDPTGFESIFNEIFNAAFGDLGIDFQSMGSTQQQEPLDIHIPIELNFYEALVGTSKKVAYKKYSSCKTCEGTGDANKNPALVCTECQGNGFLRKEVKTPLGLQITQGTCLRCKGKGLIVNDPCKMCDGTARRMEDVELTIKIPMGLDDKEELFIPEKGNYSSKGTGDLCLDVTVTGSKYFTRDGMNLHCDILVDPLMVIVGGKQLVETPWGPIEITIPAGLEPGQKIKVKGMGIKKQTKTPGLNQEGDLYLTVNVAKSDYIDENVINKLRLYINKENRYVRVNIDNIRKEIYENVKK